MSFCSSIRSASTTFYVSRSQLLLETLMVLATATNEPSQKVLKRSRQNFDGSKEHSAVQQGPQPQSRAVAGTVVIPNCFSESGSKGNNHGKRTTSSVSVVPTTFVVHWSVC